MKPFDSGSPIQASSFFVAFRSIPRDEEKDFSREGCGTDSAVRTLISQDRRMIVGFTPRKVLATASRQTIPGSRCGLVLGDTSEFNKAQSDTPMANGVLIEIDLEAKTARALTSIVGLPPVYLAEEEGQVVLTSDLTYLNGLLSSRLHFDQEGVLALCSYGFPIQHRTLFRNVRLLQGGSSLRLTLEKPIESERVWEFRPPEPMVEWQTFLELQIAAFLSSLRRMDLSQSFLSLTAGLDTRTIFAALVSAGSSVPAYTLSGESPSLDAKTARALCKAYAVPHGTIPLDAEFQRNLADLTVEASRLSGGLSSLGQAHQVYLYRKLPEAYAGRVSGNMGNQLGRKGVEHVTMRAADPAVLVPELRKRMENLPSFAWASGNTGGLATNSYEFLFQQEFPFTQLGNYSIGNFFAVQQSPYASRDLIALCDRRPVKKETDKSMSPLHLRLKDLHHRFFGEPERYSFQRRLILRTGGYVSSYPINWGWRAGGGVSLAGGFRGSLALVDAYTERAGWDSGIPGKILRTLRINGLHEHRKPKRWLREVLRDFVHDALLSKETKDAGLFDQATVSRLLEEHYAGRASHHRALVLALDLALAARNFRATLG
jgi:hypothetical protein